MSSADYKGVSYPARRSWGDGQAAQSVQIDRHGAARSVVNHYAVIALVAVRKHEALAFTGCMACPSCLLFLTKDQMGSGRQGKDAWTC
jgi:hypothetical protein